MNAKKRRRWAQRDKFRLISPGVGVRYERDETGRRHCIAVVYGGYRESLELEAVVATARRALEKWPETIEKMEVVVEPTKWEALERERAVLH